jgi:exocyst complex component 7
METLAQHAALLHESLDKSKQVTDVVVSILGSFDSHLSALDSAMHPIQIHAHTVASAGSKVPSQIGVLVGSRISAE